MLHNVDWEAVSASVAEFLTSPEASHDPSDYDDHASCAWDHLPHPAPADEPFDAGLDEADATGDWQVIVLDRFHDRLVTPSLFSRGDASIARCW